MMFRFPGPCSRCGMEQPRERWRIVRVETYGRMRTTYSINVPVCSSCHSSLQTRVMASWLVGAGVAVVAGGLALLCFTTSSGERDAGFALFFVPFIVGVVALLLGKVVAGALLGLGFAKIGGGGRRLLFSNREYQRDFDHVNGFY